MPVKGFSMDILKCVLEYLEGGERNLYYLSKEFPVGRNIAYKYVRYAVKKGYVELARTEEQQGGIKVRFYRLTDRGRQLLNLIR